MSEVPEDLNLREYREQQLEILAKDAGNSEAICELVCADALLCEENLKNFGPSWNNPSLCREIISYMPAILEDSSKLAMAENVCSRAAESLFDHPRLKLELLMLQRDAIETRCDSWTEESGLPNPEEEELGLSDLSKEIMQLQLNIMAADSGNFDAIEDNRGHLRHDPVEWTREYENAIAEAQRKADEQLAGTPRGMGFCYAWWRTLKNILLHDHNIHWRDPKEMNPQVLFD